MGLTRCQLICTILVDCWKIPDIPIMSATYHFPPGYNFFRSIPRMLKQVKDPMGTMEESMRLYNGTYRVYLGKENYIVTQDPGFIDYVLRSNHRNYQKSLLQTKQLGKFLGKGLLTSNGDFWLRQRRLIQPGFHTEKIQSLYNIIGQTVDRFLDELPEGKVNVSPYMNTLALEIVINTLFDVEISVEVRADLSRFVNETQSFVIKDIRQPYKSWWFKLSGEERHNHQLATRAREIILGIIRTRKDSGKRRNDLLDMLLEARYEDSGEGMSETQIIDEILVLIIAGHETTANALAWTLYLLAQNPEEQERVKRHVVNLSLNESVTNELLNNVIRESMRIFPPVWISDRMAVNDDQYGGFTFPGGTTIITFFYGLHHNAMLWDNAETFDPGRFSRERFDKGNTKNYYPFGGGPRLCIGNNFAMAEMAIFLQKFISRFNVHPTNQIPRMNPLITLKPDRIELEIERTAHL